MLRESEKPTLGQYLAFLRQREERRRHDAGLLPGNRKLSRERAAGEAHITASYLTKVERDEVGQVDVGILRLLTNTYHASDDEWRYVCDLAGYASPYSALADLTADMPPLEVFQDAVTPMMLTEMEEATSDLVSFYCPPRRLIVANRAYYETFPTHRPGTYMLEWSFTEEAKDMMINWNDQVEVGVAWHRGIMGRYGRTKWAQQAHQRLWQFPDFRHMWESGQVGYSVPLNLQSQLRTRGGRYAMVMENWQMEHHLPILRSRGRLQPLP
ncbi:helix-turn-helix domain-containing protein [Nocardia transvalensis]|uniref:helix-turn-helix domain-containing protein n=1 Tax=Nocardia transvalensis TaxID=37333 RepID=UPI001895DE34|nr:helix-turn-helix transcriptional regulator [Nocardia transvalensis]MBF6327565.1 helix-turn-helix domain-containing protein [Nocardia transvalensis]